MEHFFIKFVVVFFLSCIVNVYSETTDKSCRDGKPNVIFIMADDAGWNDFSFHGSHQIPTPNIDALGLSGQVLNSYYGSPLCTPTRAAVMTGKHPIHTGMQHFVIMGASAGGLPLEEKILPQFLKELGYSTHLVGKWHLGHSRKAYTPTYRGFDSHFGYWTGMQDYYDHFYEELGQYGYDFRNDTAVHFDAMGKYDTDLFTEEAIRIIHKHPKDIPMFLMINHIAPHAASPHMPLQAPIETISKFEPAIKDPKRRTYAAMVDKVDESVGFVVDALAQTNLLQNSIIVFVSDNGASPSGYDLNHGSNWPLRGVKNTLWEGGTRLSGLIWSPLIQNKVSHDLFHAKDWLPTIYEAAGGDIEKLGKIDGKSLWKTFTQGDPSPVETMLYNIDDIYNNSAIRHLQWKLIQGNTSTFDLAHAGIWDYWYGPSGRDDEPGIDLLTQVLNSQTAKALIGSGFNLNETRLKEIQNMAEVLCPLDIQPVPCDPYNVPCLFDLIEDPCEQRNVAENNPEVVSKLLQLLDEFNKTAVTPMKRYRDPNADPKKWGQVWTFWLDNIDEGITSTCELSEPPTPSRSNANQLIKVVHYWQIIGIIGSLTVSILQ